MKYTTTEATGTVEILAADQFTAIPFTVTGTTAVLAGTPMTLDGATAAAASADGILLYDVDPTENPNGALLVQGVVDATKAASHSGVSLTGLAVSGIVLRENIGTN